MVHFVGFFGVTKRMTPLHLLCRDFESQLCQPVDFHLAFILMFDACSYVSLHLSFGSRTAFLLRTALIIGYYV